jgi:hypothetical protein
VKRRTVGKQPCEIMACVISRNQASASPATARCLGRSFVLPWRHCRRIRLPTGREIELTGTFGAFEVNGRMDFVLVLWDRGTPRLRIVEAKASRKDPACLGGTAAAPIEVPAMLLQPFFTARCNQGGRVAGMLATIDRAHVTASDHEGGGGSAGPFLRVCAIAPILFSE